MTAGGNVPSLDGFWWLPLEHSGCSPGLGSEATGAPGPGTMDAFLGVERRALSSWPWPLWSGVEWIVALVS